MPWWVGGVGRGPGFHPAGWWWGTLCGCHVSLVRAGGRGVGSQGVQPDWGARLTSDTPRQGRLLERASRKKDLSLLQNLRSLTIIQLRSPLRRPRQGLLWRNHASQPCSRCGNIDQDQVLESISSCLADAPAGKLTGNPQRDYPDLLTNREAWSRITYFKY